MVWMIGFGVLFGPVLGFFKSETIINLVPFVVVMALNLLMFEAGLNVDLKTFKESLEKSGYLGVITFTLTAFVVGNLLHYLLPSTFTITEGLLFGAMIGGTSTSTILSILGSIGMSNNDAAECRLILVLESIVTDSLSIVTTMTLIRLIQMPDIPTDRGFQGHRVRVHCGHHSRVHHGGALGPDTRCGEEQAFQLHHDHRGALHELC